MKKVVDIQYFLIYFVKFLLSMKRAEVLEGKLLYEENLYFKNKEGVVHKVTFPNTFDLRRRSVGGRFLRAWLEPPRLASSPAGSQDSRLSR